MQRHPKVKIEVAYASVDEQVVIAVDCEAGDTVEQAIQKSGILQRFSEIDLQKNKLGIFSVAVKLGHVLHDGDRIEIYRPLLIDPKQARRVRANN